MAFGLEKFLVDCAHSFFSFLFFKYKKLWWEFFCPYCESVIDLCTVWMWSFQKMVAQKNIELLQMMH